MALICSAGFQFNRLSYPMFSAYELRETEATQCPLHKAEEALPIAVAASQHAKVDVHQADQIHTAKLPTNTTHVFQPTDQLIISTEELALPGFGVKELCKRCHIPSAPGVCPSCGVVEESEQPCWHGAASRKCLTRTQHVCKGCWWIAPQSWHTKNGQRRLCAHP
jgi:hypothetical protein